MNFFVFSQVINLITGLIIGLLILLKNYKSKINRHLSYFCFGVAFWSISYIFWQLSVSAQSAYFWAKILMIGASFAPLFYLTFVIHFTGDYKRKKMKVIYYGAYAITFFFIIFNIFTSLLVKNVVARMFFPFWPIGGGLFIPFLLMFFSYVIFASVLLLKFYKKSIGVKRAQAKYIFLGIGLAFLGGSTNYFLWFNIPIPPIATILVSAYPIAIGYAIVRYRLMDIRVIFKRSTNYIVSVLITLLISVFLGQLFNYYLIINPILLSIMIALFAILIFEPFRELVNRFSNTYLFSSIYNPKKITQKLSNKLTKTLEISKTCSIIINTIVGSLNLNGGKLITIEKDTTIQRCIVNFSKSILKTKTMHLFLKSYPETITFDELKALSEENPKKWQSIITYFKKHNIAIFLPLRIEKKNVGAILLKDKISGDPLYLNDIEYLGTIANHASVAVNNSLLYEEIANLNKHLQEKVDEQTKDIRQKNEKLKKLIEMRSEFLDIASHQLRTPITVINGLLEMYEQGLIHKLPKERQKSFWHDLQEKGRALRDIVNDILRASEFDTENLDITDRFHAVDMVGVIRRTVNNLAPLASKKNLEIIIEQTKNLPNVLSMEDYIIHVITNLISNAIKYTEKGKINIKAHKKGKYVYVEVSDTGIGIPKKELPNLFQKFKRASNAREMIPDGSGLGLFIVKKVINSHPGGKIWVKSIQGKGSTFGIRLHVAK